MTDTIHLSDLYEGESCRIVRLALGKKLAARLKTIGFTNGSRAECLYRSRKGSIIAFRICGAVIALRSEDSSRIEVERTS